MRPLALALALLLALPLLADDEKEGPGEEKPPKDPVQTLPGSLRPGAGATYAQDLVEGRFAGELAYSVAKGSDAGTVKVTLSSESSFGRQRLSAVVDAATRRVRSIDCDESRKREGPLSPVARLRPDPDREGGYVHERFETGKDGRPARKSSRRVKLEGTWLPARLEPFLLGLFRLDDEQPTRVRLLDPRTGRLDRKPVSYRSLGKGVMELGGRKIACRILGRTLSGKTGTLYLRDEDLLLVKWGAHGLTLVLPEPEEEAGEGPR